MSGYHPRLSVEFKSEVLRLRNQGLTSRQIADIFCISRNSIISIWHKHNPVLNGLLKRMDALNIKMDDLLNEKNIKS